jgi:hypothetical protein
MEFSLGTFYPRGISSVAGVAKLTRQRNTSRSKVVSLSYITDMLTPLSFFFV